MERIRPDLPTYPRTETPNLQPSDVSISKDELTTTAATTTGEIASHFRHALGEVYEAMTMNIDGVIVIRGQNMQLPSPVHHRCLLPLTTTRRP
ncbi:hypothetical protein HPB50_026878 [Hyalomma asiaticum]|uniref:Uncharacterized protein n=1 Tax=Hyalomma asiaticum TaxID=266040 RepID=A0ACB7TNZ6_HYAAI|nr:hypothetical protein HPB50_026878 [Hyalomma asiaticum]